MGTIDTAETTPWRKDRIRSRSIASRYNWSVLSQKYQDL